MSATQHAPEGFTWTEESWGRGLRSDALSRIANHVFTTRDLALGSNDGEWSAVAEALGATQLVRLRQVHGADVFVVRRGHPSNGDRPSADIVISDDPAVAIAVQAADCVPLLIADPRTGVVAAAHAGWKGMSTRVPERAVRALIDTFGARAADLVAAAGPSIGPCCYEVGPELEASFANAGFTSDERRRWFAAGRGDRLMLDLWTATIDQLTDAGVPIGSIAAARTCTAHHADLFPSYRRDRDRAGRLAGAIVARDVTARARTRP